jgi:transcription termination factor Rho
MQTGPIEGILQVTDERQDGQLRDPQQPLRPVRGNILVPKQLIRQMQLRPGLLLKGTPRGRNLDRIEQIENLHPDE